MPGRIDDHPIRMVAGTSRIDRTGVGEETVGIDYSGFDAARGDTAVFLRSVEPDAVGIDGNIGHRGKRPSERLRVGLTSGGRYPGEDAVRPHSESGNAVECIIRNVDE